MAWLLLRAAPQAVSCSFWARVEKLLGEKELWSFQHRGSDFRRIIFSPQTPGRPVLLAFYCHTWVRVHHTLYLVRRKKSHLLSKRASLGLNWSSLRKSIMSPSVIKKKKWQRRILSYTSSSEIQSQRVKAKLSDWLFETFKHSSDSAHLVPTLSQALKLFGWFCYLSDTQVAQMSSWEKAFWRLSSHPPRLYFKQSLSDTIKNMGRKGQLHTRKYGVPFWVKESERALGFIDWISMAGQLPPRKAWYSCPLREPAWKGYRSYWVIRTCQHLGYAGWFNPIMWMEPVIVLMKSTPVSKGPWMIFCSFSVYT